MEREPTVVLTGGTSGIGRVAARRLAERGARVLVTGRDPRRGEAVREIVRGAHPEDEGEFYRADFADLEDVRALATALRADVDHLDVLVNNAGTIQRSRRLTDDGLEYTFQVNHVAPFLLTSILVDRLRASPGGRVLNTVTAARDDSLTDMTEADLSDLDGVAVGEPYDFERAYLNAKLSTLLCTFELAERLAGTGVTATCFHPGMVPGTNVARDAGVTYRLVFGLASLVARVKPIGPMTTTSDAADTLVHLALDRELPDGEGTYFHQGERRDPGSFAHDEELRARVWAFSAELAGCTDSVLVE